MQKLHINSPGSGLRRDDSALSASARLWTRLAHPVALVSALVFLVGGLAWGVSLEGGNFGLDEQNGMTATANAGVGVFFVSLPLGAYSFGLALVHARSSLSALYAAAEAVLLAGGCGSGIVVAASVWLQPSIIWQQQTGDQWPDTLQQLFAALAIPTFAFLAVAALCAAYYHARDAYRELTTDGEEGGKDGGGRKASSNSSLIQPYGWRGRVLGTLGGVLVLGAFFALTTFVNPIWYTGFAQYTQGPAQAQVNGMWEGLIVPVVVYLQSAADVAANFWQAQVVFNLYLDAVVYFTVLIAFLVLGLASTFLPKVRNALHRRVRVPLPEYVNTFRHGATVGELLATAAVAGLYAFWFWYWSSSNIRVSQDINGSGSRWPRTLGHMTTLSMSLLTFPVTRNSILTAAFGIPFERSVKFHRMLGRLCWVFVTIHMVLWQVKWIQEGTFKMNLTTLTNLTLDPTTTHPNNFTIPLAEIAWLALTLALLAAGLLRRYSFETFQYTHTVVLFFFLVGIIHAWAHWYYTAGGLLLWGVDKLVRTVTSAREATLVSLSHAAGITRLEVRSAALCSAAAGQYAFVGLPALGPLQWHPFTIASTPAEIRATGTCVFHIRNMGPGTWTCGLADLACAVAEGTVALSDLAVSVDGPYGRAGHYYERRSVVLVAGGIGITPLASIVGDLYARATDPDVNGDMAQVRSVHLVWVARDRALFTVYASLLAQILRDNAGGVFKIHLFSSDSKAAAAAGEAEDAETPYGMDATLLGGGSKSARGKKAGGGGGGDPAQHHPGRDIDPSSVGWCDPVDGAAVLRSVRSGRPDLDAIFAEATRGASTPRNESVSALVCGPAELVQSVSNVAFREDLDFHAEVFHW